MTESFELYQRQQRLALRDYLRSIDPHCLYCGRFLKVKRTTLDHVIPISRGGRHYVENFTLACRTCNAAKGERTPLEWLADLQRACRILAGSDRTRWIDRAWFPLRTATSQTTKGHADVS